MSDTANWEEARRCPKCKHPGNDMRQVKKDKSVVHVLLCENKVCPWYNTTWIVQIMDDGTIPTQSPEEGAAHKNFPEVPAAKRHPEALLAQITREEEIDATPPT